MISITKYSELDDKTITALKSFIDTEFGHIPIVSETQWTSPGITRIFYENNKIDLLLENIFTIRKNTNVISKSDLSFSKIGKPNFW